MTNETYAQLEDIFLHKKLVFDSCLKMSKYLHSIGKDDFAIEICRRAALHDNSKLDDNELNNFCKLDKSKVLLKNPYAQIDGDTERVIEIHWHKNRHHPEFFNDISQMDEIDIIEMCCDWHARSVQYGTDLLEFARIRQENRFHFDDETFKRILEYCKALIA